MSAFCRLVVQSSHAIASLCSHFGSILTVPLPRRALVGLPPKQSSKPLPVETLLPSCKIWSRLFPLGSVSLTSDCCLFHYQITSDFFIKVQHKLNASTINTQQSAIIYIESRTERSIVIKWKDRSCVTENVIPKIVRRAYSSLLLFGTITKHTWWWDIDEKNKILNLTCFHPKSIGNVGNKNNSSLNIIFVAKTSDVCCVVALRTAVS